MLSAGEATRVVAAMAVAVVVVRFGPKVVVAVQHPKVGWLNHKVNVGDLNPKLVDHPNRKVRCVLRRVARHRIMACHRVHCHGLGLIQADTVGDRVKVAVISGYPFL